MLASAGSDVAAGRLTDSPALLWNCLAEPGSAQQFSAAWLALQCSMLDGAVRAVLVLGSPDTGPFMPEAFWPSGEPASALLAEVADLAMQARQPALLQRDEHSALAYPVSVDNHLHGLVALETVRHEDAVLQWQMRQLQWGVQGIVAAILRQQSTREQATRERLMGILDLVASAMTEQRFLPAAHALSTDLATRLDCDRVSIGFRQKERTHVHAVSHSAQIAKRMNLIRAIGSAMDEAIDQKSPVQIPAPSEQILVTRDHAALARQHGSDFILSIPFVTSGLVVGAFTFERSGARPFQTHEIELCQAVVALCSRILEEKRLNDRLLLARVKDLACDELIKFTGPRHFARKLTLAALAFALVFFSFARSDYSVGANATLEGAVRRVLVAPYDGYVDTAMLRAGDVVKAGAVLATLDQRDLQLEYLRWESQADQYAQQYQEARAKSDRVQINIIQEQMQQAKAQMDLLAEQLARASIKAPFDGVIVSGDLSQSLGSAVKRGQTLFEVAPLNTYRVILEVDESDIADIHEGLPGKLMLTSLSGEVFPLRIGHLTPVTVSREGRSYFRVEASVGQVSARLRPGMEGVGKIETGSRHLIWQWTHKMFNWLRLSLWSWV